MKTNRGARTPETPGSPEREESGKKRGKTTETGRGTARMITGGTGCESGCDGRSASTEPDEGVTWVLHEAAPPLLDDQEMRM
jgi:hypothetical protein